MQQIVITISEIYLDRLDIVAEEFHLEGLIITRLFEFGVIIGIAEDETISKIRAHEWVLSLEIEKKPNTLPPDNSF